MKSMALAFLMILFGCTDPAKHLYAEAQDPDLLYRAKCTACHRIYRPQNYTYQKFQTYVTRYGKGLSDEECQRLLEYLRKNAKEERE